MACPRCVGPWCAKRFWPEAAQEEERIHTRTYAAAQLTDARTPWPAASAIELGALPALQTRQAVRHSRQRPDRQPTDRGGPADNVRSPRPRGALGGGGGGAVAARRRAEVRPSDPPCSSGSSSGGRGAEGGRAAWLRTQAAQRACQLRIQLAVARRGAQKHTKSAPQRQCGALQLHALCTPQPATAANWVQCDRVAPRSVGGS